MAQAEVARRLGARFVLLGIPDWTPGKSLEEESDAFFSLLCGPAVGEAVLDHMARDTTDVLVVDCMLTSALAAAERASIPSAAIVQVLNEQFVAGTMGRRRTAGNRDVAAWRAPDRRGNRHGPSQNHPPRCQELLRYCL